MNYISRIVFIVILGLIISCTKDSLQVIEKELDLYEIGSDSKLSEIQEDLEGVKRIKILQLFNFEEVVDLSFLKEVEEIDQLILSGCDGLLSLGGLENTVISGVVLITACDNLQSIEGLQQIESLYSLHVSNCTSIRTINLENLVEIKSGLLIAGVNDLKNMGFLKLREIGAELSVSDCLNLEEINIPFLEKTGMGVLITNTGVNDLDELSRLREVKSIMIRGNRELEDVEGLSSLRKTNEINIWSNPIIDFCPLKNLIIENPEINFRIESESLGSLNRLDFESCE